MKQPYMNLNHYGMGPKSTNAIATAQQLEVMRLLVGWMLLAGWMYGLNADLIAHLHPPISAISTIPCVFPFTYGDIIYYNCVSVHSDFDWCSLDSHFKGRWRYCTARDPPPCIFPFTFRKTTFDNCTKEGYILNRSWCSLTSNYNKDRRWKQCSPQK
ncbi:binder of sperm protein homolog 2-like [Castor canadensis]|uniref:Binder of sperm protein homolog 2-like n=1 Tax=Castor canadensis TaxID=51338 RepID=A0AC58L8G7_CASCN